MGHWVRLPISVICEVDVVQQCTEAQADMVQDGLSKQFQVTKTHSVLKFLYMTEKDLKHSQALSHTMSFL